MKERYPLIVFEGLDGAGTTSHSQALVRRLRPKYSVSWTCEPTRGPVGLFVRELFEGKHGDRLPSWEAMTLLFQADRAMHRQYLEEELSRQIVVCDRYWLSGMAYQTASAMEQGEKRDEVLDFILSLNRRMPVPAITILLEVTVEEGLRRKKKAPDLFERREYLEQVNKIYKGLFLPPMNIVRIDTERPFEEVEEQIDVVVRSIVGG